jgi:hypothetical protein
VYYPARLDVQEHKHVQGLEEHRLHGEKVAGDDTIGLRGKELAPGRAVAAWGRTEACVAKDRTDRRGGDPDAQALELAFDPYAPPPRVLPGHAKDQFLDLDIDRWMALPAVGERPFAPDNFAVPACQRRSVTGVTMNAAQRSRASIRLIAVRNSSYAPTRALDLTAQHGELVAQHQHLGFGV